MGCRSHRCMLGKNQIITLLTSRKYYSNLVHEHVLQKVHNWIIVISICVGAYTNISTVAVQSMDIWSMVLIDNMKLYFYHKEAWLVLFSNFSN